MDLNLNSPSEGSEAGKDGLVKSSWRERFQQELSTQEMRFLLNTFGKTSLRFFCFGVCVFGLNAIAERIVPGIYLTLFYVFLLISTLVSFIPSFFMRRKLERNPLAISKSTKSALFALTYFQFIAMFLTLIHMYQTYVHSASTGVGKEVAGAILTAAAFGIAWIVYLIPVFVAWFCMTRKQAVKLNSFIIRCTLVLIPISLLSLLFLFMGVGGIFASFVIMVCMLMFTILAMLCPFVTLYRFKAVSHTIDYTNEEEKKSWEDYFGFVMLEQMLVLALRIMHIVVRALGRR